MLDKGATEDNFSDTPRNIFNSDESGIQINNKLGAIIAEKWSKSVNVLTSWVKSKNITVIACCNAAGQFLPPPPTLFWYSRKSTRHKEFGDGIPPGSGVYTKRKSSYSGTGLFIKWFTGHFLNHNASGKVIVPSDGHRAHCSSPLLLQIAVENNVIVIRIPSHCTYILQPLN